MVPFNGYLFTLITDQYVRKSHFFNNHHDTKKTNKIYKFIGIVKNIFKRKSQSGNVYGVIEASDVEGDIEILVDLKNLCFIEENLNKNQIFIFNIEIRFDKNSGIRIICQSIHKLFDNISNKIKSLDLLMTDKICLKSLKDEIYKVKNGNTNINVVIKKDNIAIRIFLNENIKITDLFINNISKVPFLEKIIFK